MIASNMNDLQSASGAARAMSLPAGLRQGERTPGKPGFPEPGSVSRHNFVRAAYKIDGRNMAIPYKLHIKRAALKAGVRLGQALRSPLPRAHGARSHRELLYQIRMMRTLPLVIARSEATKQSGSGFPASPRPHEIAAAPCGRLAMTIITTGTDQTDLVFYCNECRAACDRQLCGRAAPVSAFNSPRRNCRKAVTAASSGLMPAMFCVR
jgi:hypothetical protein